jgi:hypothetical protein
MVMLKSKIEIMLGELKAEGKVTTLSDEEVMAIDEHIRRCMEGFKYDLLRKQKQSEDDLRRIILNA